MMLISIGILGFSGINKTYFWDDEAQVGIIARNFLNNGKLTGWDGRNLYGYRNGTVLDQNLRPINPPLDFLLTALSFKIFGVSTWSGRFPFVCAGMLAFLLFLWITYKDFGRYKAIWVFMVGSLAFSVNFFLFIRQCRYYSLVMLFSLAVFLSYRKLLDTEKNRYILPLSLSAILLFYSNYLISGAFLLSLALVYLIIHGKSLNYRKLLKPVWAAIIFLAATVPYAVYYKIWIRPDMPVEEGFLVRTMKLVMWNLRDINVCAMLPWSLALGLVFAVIIKRKDVYLLKRSGEWLGIAVSFLIFLAMFSLQRTDIDPVAAVRYLVPLLPFFAVAAGIVLGVLYQYSKIPAIILFLVLVCTNIMTMPMGTTYFRWLLPSYLSEIRNPYPESYKSTVQYLKSVVGQDETILALPTYTNYPLMFYLGNRLKICSIIESHSPLAEKAEKLAAPLILEKNFPDRIILFGKSPKASRVIKYFQRPHVTEMGEISYEYRLEKFIDVFWYATHRPELMWHRFDPVREFDKKNQGVYSYRRFRRGALRTGK